MFIAYARCIFLYMQSTSPFWEFLIVAEFGLSLSTVGSDGYFPVVLGGRHEEQCVEEDVVSIYA